MRHPTGGPALAGPSTQAGRSAQARHAVLVSRRRRRRVAGAVVAILSAGVAWLLFRLGQPAGGIVALAVAGGVIGITLQTGRDVDRWARGAAGELGTAEVLAGLSRRRWEVRHDVAVPGSRANIDHLVVGRTGVWVIDSKSTRAEVRARFGAVRFGRRYLDTASLRWEASVVEDRLDAAGWDVPVRPLVAVHGHGLRPRGGRAGGIRVLPVDSVTGHLRHGRRRIRRRDIPEVASALDRVFVPAWEPVERRYAVSAGGRPGERGRRRD